MRMKKEKIRISKFKYFRELKRETEGRTRENQKGKEE